MGWFGHHDGTVEHVRVRKRRWGDEPRAYNLSPCPKCGSERVSVWYVGAIGRGGWRGICANCLYLPDRLCDEEQAAVDLWNGVIT